MTALPTGLVTFLLTDIEGSTRAWQAARPGLATSIQRHYELLDRWVRDQGGVRPEEQGEGDSLVAAFADPRRALDAAVGAQRQLLTELPDLPVRMALHSGEASLRDDRNYVGLTVIRCARIRSCGHGGQILVSRATVDAVGDLLPGGVTVRPLGWYGLKGLSGRTEIAQVVASGLPDAFPPLQAGASAAGNLPQGVSSFVGRRRELAALTSVIDRSRWVTVTGDAGVGKSRLALAAAAAGAEGYPGGAWWIALADTAGGSVDEIASTIANACSAERRAGPLGDVTAFFESQAASLLVLDGVDVVSGSMLAMVRHLLAATAELRIVITCREAASVAGETPFQLEPYHPPVATTEEELAGTDAGELFLERRRDAGALDPLDRADVAAVVRICRRWRTAADLEMIAIRAASTPVPELAAELEQLGRSATSALASSTHWHLRALADDDRAVLRRCATFRRAAAPDAVLAVVVGDGLDADAVTASLGLLTERRVLRDDDGRLHLDDRFREVIATWPPDDRRDAVAGRHVAWFTSVAERFEASGSLVSASWLVDDLADVMAALAEAMERSTPEAYRMLRALAPRWHELDRWPELWAASTWLATRSPSDGELAWVAAVSRVSFAAAGRPDADVHRLRDEAVAVARLDHDDVSSDYLAFGPSAAALAEGDPTPALDLFHAAVAHGTEAVALAIADRLVEAPSPGRRSDLVAYLAQRAEGGVQRDPVAALVAHGRRRRDDERLG